MFATDQEQSEPACYSRRVVNEITLRAPSQGSKALEATELKPLARNNSAAPTEPFSTAHEVALKQSPDIMRRGQTMGVRSCGHSSIFFTASIAGHVWLKCAS